MKAELDSTPSVVGVAGILRIEAALAGSVIGQVFGALRSLMLRNRLRLYMVATLYARVDIPRDNIVLEHRSFPPAVTAKEPADMLFVCRQSPNCDEPPEALTCDARFSHHVG